MTINNLTARIGTAMQVNNRSENQHRPAPLFVTSLKKQETNEPMFENFNPRNMLHQNLLAKNYFFVLFIYLRQFKITENINLSCGNI